MKLKIFATAAMIKRVAATFVARTLPRDILLREAAYERSKDETPKTVPNPPPSPFESPKITKAEAAELLAMMTNGVQVDTSPISDMEATYQEIDKIKAEVEAEIKRMRENGELHND